MDRGSRPFLARGGPALAGFCTSGWSKPQEAGLSKHRQNRLPVLSQWVICDVGFSSLQRYPGHPQSCPQSESYWTGFRPTTATGCAIVRFRRGAISSPHIPSLPEIYWCFAAFHLKQFKKVLASWGGCLIYQLSASSTSRPTSTSPDHLLELRGFNWKPFNMANSRPDTIRAHWKCIAGANSC